MVNDGRSTCLVAVDNSEAQLRTGSILPTSGLASFHSIPKSRSSSQIYTGIHFLNISKKIILTLFIETYYGMIIKDFFCLIVLFQVNSPS